MSKMLLHFVKVIVAQLCPTLCVPHGLKTPRLLCPWNSPGKNSGVGCHSLLQGIFLTQEPVSLAPPALQADSLPSEPPGKPEFLYSKVKFLRAIQLQAWRGEIYQSKLGLLGRENWNKPSKWIDFWILHVIEPKEEIHLVHNRKCEQYQSDQYIGLVWHFGWAVYRRCVFSSWSESADVS